MKSASSVIDQHDAAGGDGIGVTLKRALRTRLGRPLQSLGYATGAMQFTARLRGLRGAVILMYHSVAEGEARWFIDPRNHVPAEVFHEQMTFLARHRTVVSLTDLVDSIKRGETPSEGTTVITFDDGYLDNLATAAPILSRHGLAATLFLPTAYIDRREPQWVDQAFTMFAGRTNHVLAWDGNERTFDLIIPAQCEEAYMAVCMSLLFAGAESRRTLLDDLQRQLAPGEQSPDLTMSWDDVHTLLKKHPDIEIGGHTVEHTALSNQSDDEAWQELTGCMKRIEEQIGHRPRHFSFPYGRATAALRHRVAEAGFESACGGVGDPLVTAATNPFALPRIAAPTSMERFDLLTSSANTGLWRRLGR